MTANADYPEVDEFTSSPIARIDAQDEGYVFPLREYLETNGCRVFVNPASDISVMYHIAAGDAEFVKYIFARKHAGNYRRLGILIGSSLTDGENAANDTTKIILVDPVFLSPQQVLEIFSFFFAGIQNVLDKRRNIHEPAPIGAAITGPESVSGATGEIPTVRQTVYGHSPVKPGTSDENETASKLMVSDKERIGSLIAEVFSGTEKGTHGNNKKKRKRASKFLKALIVQSSIIIAIFFFPIVWYLGSLSVSALSLEMAAKNLAASKTETAGKYIILSEYWKNQSSLILYIGNIPLDWMGLRHLLRGQERLLSLISDMLATMKDTEKIAASGRQLTNMFLPDAVNSDVQTIAPAIQSIEIETESAHNHIGLAEAQLETLLNERTFPFTVPLIHEKASEALTKMKEARVLLSQMNNVLLLYPRVSGFTQPKTYLVLLQNSNELRPTGGFIGSVGVAKFEDGVLSDFSIQDVYALDGQLKGHVDPPKPIRDILSQEHWYLRDSNWDPDFKSSASRAQWFYEKETGVHPDGVIAVNVPFIVDILKATGPIQLPDYNDRISADNFFGKSFYYTQNNFFPGSTQKKDFLGALMRAMMTKIMTDKDVSPGRLFTAFMDSVASRDVLFQFDDPESQSLVEHFDWAGRIFAEEGCSGVDKQYCLFDPVAINEANLSVSKVNYFVKRDAVREITFSSGGGVNEEISLTLQNTENSASAEPVPGIGGPYVTYLRFLLPSDSIVNDVRLNDTIVATKKPGDTSAKLPYIEKSEGPPGSLVIGVAMTVAPGTQSKVRISYARNIQLSFGKGGAVYDSLWFKQPGVNSIPIKTLVRYPLYWLASDEKGRQRAFQQSDTLSADDGSSLVAKDGQLEYNNQLRTDQSIRVKFIK